MSLAEPLPLPSSVVQVEEQTTSFSCLPPHLQLLILAASGAPFNTCKAAAAVLSDTNLLVTWLRACKPFPVLLATAHQRWDVCQRLRFCGNFAACEVDLQLSLLLAARRGQLQAVRALLQLVQLPPGPTITEHMQRTKCPYQGGQLKGKALTGDSHKAVKLMHPLVAAAAGGHLEVCEVLLAAGAGADAVASAARKAAEGGHLAVCLCFGK
jgi:hypothetical protein